MTPPTAEKVLPELIGESPEIVALRTGLVRLLASVGARRPPPILIQGETGTGKGLLAAALHRAGPRAGGPFVPVNCAAIPETLIEAEMFGFERGAFTDARQAKPGLLAVANRGTLFLDEVALLPEPLQGKLLKALEEGEVRRLGATRGEPIDIWILAATSEDLAAARQAGRFLEALYHRLSVVVFRLPPLRERGQDALLLAERFLERACADYGLPAGRFAPDARRALLGYAWPGNVRELANVIERAALFSDQPLVTAAQLGLPEGGPARPSGARVRPERSPTSPDDPRLDLEPDDLLEALRQTRWNISRAAARLGIPRNTLRYRIERFGLRPGSPGPLREPAPMPSAADARPLDAPAGSLSVRWEQRRVTLLRVALTAPDGATAAEDPDSLDLIVGKVATFGGRLEELSASGIVAAFGLEPVEDAPRRGAHAAMAIQKAAERAPTPRGPVAVRQAIHVGEFVVGHASGAAEMLLEGKQDAWAALQALIDGTARNTITVSEAAAPFLAQRFDLTPLTVAPGATRPRYRLGGLESAEIGARRRLTRYVGRGPELELLERHLTRATAGSGQVVGIVGEPGIGKSRLLFEFRRRLAAEAVTFLEGHCVSYGSAIPYLPVLDLVRDHCGISETDTPEAIGDKVRARLAAVGLNPEDGAPYLLHLLGAKEGTDQLTFVSPEAIQARTFETLRQLTLRASRQRALVLAIENLHWIDRTSEEYLASLVEGLTAAPVLLLLTYRPGFRPPWIDKSYATQMALQPLAARESLALVRSLLPAEAAPDPVAQLLLSRAEGNPFFLEELALATAEHGEAPADATVPATIQDVLLARISRLPDESKGVLQTAAVIGREVPLKLLRATWPGPGALEPHLRELSRLEFLYERPGPEEAVYLFKHALTREVAYTGLLPGRRRELHATTARALETLHADRLEEVADRLADHYVGSGDAARAVHYLTRVADRSARHYAHVEAATVLREAVTQAERLPAGERDRCLVELTLRQAHSLYFLGRFSESLDLLLHQEERVRGLADPALSGAHAFWLAYTYSHLGDHARADEQARRAIAEAERSGDTATRGRALYVLLRGAFWSGQFADGARHGREAVALLGGPRERWWLGAAHWGLAFNYGFMGEFARALEAAAVAQAIGEELGDPRLQTYAAWTTGWIRASMGEWEAGIAACRQSLEHSPDPVNTADALSFLGAAYLEQGDADQAIPSLTEAVGQWRQFEHRPMLAWFTSLLGEAHLLKGEVARARELTEQGLAIAERVGFRYGVGWARRTLGRIARARGELAKAATHLCEALETFATIEARFEAARTRLDLAALAQHRGLAGEAVSLAEGALAAFEGLGVPLYAARAREIVAGVTEPRPSRESPPARS